MFEPNVGQTRSDVQFVARGRGYALFLAPRQAMLKMRKPASALGARQAPDRLIQLKLAGANPAPVVRPEQPTATVVNYLRGQRQERWRTGVPTYAQVRYHEVYPGIDLVYYGSNNQVEYDFQVAPGASPHQIAWQLTGADHARLAKNGDLILPTSGADVVWKRPQVYQTINGKRVPVAGSYTLQTRNGATAIGFQVARYDTRLSLVIDPVLRYSTFFGGGAFDQANAVASDAARNAYVTGQTQSVDLPASTGAAQPHFAGNVDAFVAKLNSSGVFTYITYLGGSNADYGTAIAADRNGAAYVAGYTTSSDFPTTKGAFQTYYRAGIEAAFVTKLNATGGVVYSTYLGASWDEVANAIAVDSAGSAYVVGRSASNDFPTTTGAFQTQRKGLNWSAFLTKFNATGTGLVYSTLLNGRTDAEATAVAVDASGDAIVGGATSARDFPVTAGVPQTIKAGSCFLVSHDGGRTWTINEQGMSLATSVDGLAVDPKTPTTLYCWGDLGVEKSTDGAATWHFANVNPYINKLTIDPTNTNNLWLAYWNGVAKSTDAGNSWNWGLNLKADCRDVVVDPTNSSTLYVASIQSVYKSTNGGATWSSIVTGLPKDVGGNPNAYAIAIDPKSASTLYLGTSFGAFKTVNGGGKWSAINTGMPTTHNNPYGVDEIQVCSTNSAILLARSQYNSYLMRSTNGGQSWGRTTLTGTGGFAMDPTNPSVIFDAHWWGVQKSIDRGLNWADLMDQYLNFNDIKISPADHNTLYLAAFVTFDAFVTKFNATGTSLVYSTLLGGTAYEWLRGLALDSAGNAYVSGPTRSEDFPTQNAWQPWLTGYQNGYLAKLSPTGALLFSTYFGSSDYDDVFGLALDASNNPVVVGYTDSEDFPVAGNYLQSGTAGRPDAYLLKMKSDGSGLLYSTYLSGGGYDEALGVASNSSSDLFVVGQTVSSDFPMVNSAYGSLKPNTDAFIAAFTDKAPVKLMSVTFTPNNVPGSVTATGTVTLSAAAPYDLLLWLTTNNALAYVQPFLTVPKGATSKTFPVYTQGVTAPVVVAVTAGYDTFPSVNLTLRPVALQSLSANPLTVKSHATFDLTATLEIPSVFGTSVVLSSSNPSVVPVPATLFVPGGSATNKTTITTGTVSGTSVNVTITATAGGVTKTVQVQVTQ
jgi:hypothetical protein